LPWLRRTKAKLMRIVWALPILVAARSKAWFCGRSLARFAILNPAGENGWMSVVSAVFCQIEVCDGLITRQE
jgi:hypothetical protein